MGLEPSKLGLQFDAYLGTKVVKANEFMPNLKVDQFMPNVKVDRFMPNVKVDRFMPVVNADMTYCINKEQKLYIKKK